MITEGKIVKRNENMSPQNLYLNAHGSFTHNNPKLETAKMSINCWAGKQTVIYSYDGSEPSNQKEQIAENATT